LPRPPRVGAIALGEWGAAEDGINRHLHQRTQDAAAYQFCQAPPPARIFYAGFKAMCLERRMEYAWWPCLVFRKFNSQRDLDVGAFLGAAYGAMDEVVPCRIAV
jgi:hypothetical protein